MAASSQASLFVIDNGLSYSVRKHLGRSIGDYLTTKCGFSLVCDDLGKQFAFC